MLITRPRRPRWRFFSIKKKLRGVRISFKRRMLKVIKEFRINLLTLVDVLTDSAIVIPAALTFLVVHNVITRYRPGRL